MEELLIKLPGYLVVGAQYLASLVIIATVVVRITPSKSDNAKVKKISETIFKVIAYLPTLGVNPKTQKLEKAYKELSGE